MFKSVSKQLRLLRSNWRDGDESKNRGGLRDDRNFNGGMQKKKPLEEAGFAQFEQCVFDSWDAVSRVARLEATET